MLMKRAHVSRVISRLVSLWAHMRRSRATNLVYWLWA
jgi:hypothetical protein